MFFIFIFCYKIIIKYYYSIIWNKSPRVVIRGDLFKQFKALNSFFTNNKQHTKEFRSNLIDINSNSNTWIRNNFHIC